MADKMLIDGLIKFCDEKSKNIKLKAEPQVFVEIKQALEELKALKEKNTPMELSEHNFQDEVHHYLCPSCRSIVNCNQNYCEECGQALET